MWDVGGSSLPIPPFHFVEFFQPADQQVQPQADEAEQARVIRDPKTQTLTPGDILVARHTDPGWISVFCNASAIVVERGSLLSHSAIVARELGIPCVVGLKDATHWIMDGDEIFVDGATGRVEKSDAKL